jgi:hypothetical protein
MTSQDSVFQWGGHSIAGSTLFATLIGWLPQIAALVTVAWGLLQIYESKTFQTFKFNFIARHREKRLAKLLAKEKVVLAQIAALELARHAKVVASDIVAVAKSDASALMVQAATDAALTAPKE